MKASEILPFLFFMGISSLAFYILWGNERFFGASTAYLLVVVFVVVFELLERRRKVVR